MSEENKQLKKQLKEMRMRRKRTQIPVNNMTRTQKIR